MIRRALLLAPAALAAFACAGTVKMDVKGPGITGVATVTNKLNESGGKLVTLEMKLNQGGKTALVTQESDYAPNGRPIRKLQRTRQSGGGLDQTILAVFNKSTVKVTVTNSGKSNSFDVKMPASGLEAKYELWFLKSKPPVGGVNSFQHFDISRQRWVPTKAQYLGMADVTASGKAYKAHKVKMGDTTAYLDSKGDPVKVIQGQTTMERQA